MSKDSHRSTCSPAADSGPSQPDLQDGLTTDLFGQPVVPASRSRLRERGLEPMIQGICGRTYIGSQVPSGPLSSWESRLRERLAMVGSTESALLWKAKTTPAGRSMSRLAPSTRHTNGTDCTGSQWRSPTAGHNRGGAYSDPQKAEARIQSGHTVNLEDQMVAAYYATPRASDGEKGGPNQAFGAGGQPLPAQMAQAAFWNTASARDWMDTPGMATQAKNPDGTARTRLDRLPRQMAAAYHATPLALSFKDSHQPGTNRSIEKMKAYMPAQTEPTGRTPSGSNATTAKRAVANPVFPFWLMGFPDAWICGALEATRLFRLLRRKSSRR